MGHTYTHIYIYTYHTYIYIIIYIHTTRIQGVWNDWTDTVDVCHFLWLFYDGGSLCYIIQPICVYVLDCLSLSLPHYIPMIFPKMVIRLNYLKFLCYRIIWLIYIYPIKFPYVPILSNESTFFSPKKEWVVRGLAQRMPLWWAVPNLDSCAGDLRYRSHQLAMLPSATGFSSSKNDGLTSEKSQFFSNKDWKFGSKCVQ